MWVSATRTQWTPWSPVPETRNTLLFGRPDDTPRACEPRRSSPALLCWAIVPWVLPSCQWRLSIRSGCRPSQRRGETALRTMHVAGRGLEEVRLFLAHVGGAFGPQGRRGDGYRAKGSLYGFVAVEAVIRPVQAAAARTRTRPSVAARGARGTLRQPKTSAPSPRPAKSPTRDVVLPEQHSDTVAACAVRRCERSDHASPRR